MASISAMMWPLDPPDDAAYAVLELLHGHVRYNGKSSKGAAAFVTALTSASSHVSIHETALRKARRCWSSIGMPASRGLCPQCDVDPTAEHGRRCGNIESRNTASHEGVPKSSSGVAGGPEPAASRYVPLRLC